MPKRTDIEKILLIGAGPIVIGQACEFDYSGTQACKALHEEGYTVILVNSNPATIMTDPQFADRTYVEPVDAETVAKIIEIERPDAILPTLGGQTALNVAVKLARDGILKKFNVEMIGASEEAIDRAEDRELFRACMNKIGVAVPESGLARSIEEARTVVEEVGLPCVIRPAYTLGGAGGGIAYNIEEFETIARRGLELSMIHEILIEESIAGWKEFELEVMRDHADNVVIICSIENFDPLGVHTGDSITVAPAQTLTDKEYQVLRDAAIKIIREIGVATGGSNVQFAVNPENGRMVAIEINPRVSRSSALASKATGFPIAKFAAKLAVGYTLDEIPNDITKTTPACFEPTIDYCVVKIPRFTFEKFPLADSTLTTQMKSVGEVMSIGRTFKEALQKAMRSMETTRAGLGLDRKDRFWGAHPPLEKEIHDFLKRPNAERLLYIRYAMKSGIDIKEIYELTKIDPWFLGQIREIVDQEEKLARLGSLEVADAAAIRKAKTFGFSDAQLAVLWKTDEKTVRKTRLQKGVKPVYKLVDTCAAEFEAKTPYYYSTYEQENEIRKTGRPKIMILGGGPNRIGQGIEFDYCCVHAAFALRELGYETIMINSNPETVSTDYDTSDDLFFEPVTVEDVLNIWEELAPQGAIVQFGGQTPLNIVKALEAGGVTVIGTSVADIDTAEDRDKFQQVVRELKLLQPENGIARSLSEARQVATALGYPVLVRPSYVLGGRAMQIVYDEKDLERFVKEAFDVAPEHPVLVDKFLEDAIEVDVDVVADGQLSVIGGIMEHIEEAGIHSGDSCCVLPPYSLSDKIVGDIRAAAHALAVRLHVKGLMNIQFAVKNERVYVLEVNPRASRTVPFVSKATGVPLAKIAAKVMVGKTLAELGFTEEPAPAHFSVKEPVFPFTRFPGVDILLGPEMKSTGEVMGIDFDLGCALAKAKQGGGGRLPPSGRVFLSVKDADKRSVIPIAKRLETLGFELIATDGTYRVLKRSGIQVERVNKLSEGRPNIRDLIKNSQIRLIINTPSGKDPRADEAVIRSAAVSHGVVCITTMSGAAAAVNGIESTARQGLSPKALQDYHAAGAQSEEARPGTDSHKASVRI